MAGEPRCESDASTAAGSARFGKHPHDRCRGLQPATEPGWKVTGSRRLRVAEIDVDDGLLRPGQRAKARRFAHLDRGRHPLSPPCRCRRGQSEAARQQPDAAAARANGSEGRAPPCADSVGRQHQRQHAGIGGGARRAEGGGTQDDDQAGGCGRTRLAARPGGIGGEYRRRGSGCQRRSCGLIDRTRPLYFVGESVRAGSQSERAAGSVPRGGQVVSGRPRRCCMRRRSG